MVEIYSKSDCRCFGVLALLIVCVDSDADVLWLQLFCFTYFVEPDGRIRL
jgi:hypothetical protein